MTESTDFWRRCERVALAGLNNKRHSEEEGLSWHSARGIRRLSKSRSLISYVLAPRFRRGWGDSKKRVRQKIRNLLIPMKARRARPAI